MGHFDAEKKRANEIVSQYGTWKPTIEKNGAESTAELRHFIAKVEKHQHSLLEIAATAAKRLEFVDAVEKNIDMLEDCLKKAQSNNEAYAADVLKGAKYGRLVFYDHDKGKPAKPQLIKAVEEALGREVLRGKNIIAEVEKSTQAWRVSADKHVKWCEKAKAAVAGAAF